MVPRGADAVVMVEHTDLEDRATTVRRPPPVAPGATSPSPAPTSAGARRCCGAATLLTSRETGVLAALGLAAVPWSAGRAWPSSRPATSSSPPGDADAAGLRLRQQRRPSSPTPSASWAASRSRSASCRDDAAALRARARGGARACDVVLLSGGTSKGAGDLSYRVVGRAGPAGHRRPRRRPEAGQAAVPGACAPGRPCRSSILPGFPTSAIFTFHEFVAPVIRRLAGRARRAAEACRARLPLRVNSERGRTEYLLVGLVDGRSRRVRGLSDGQGLRLGDHLQPGRRLRRHPAAPRVPGGGERGRGHRSSAAGCGRPTWWSIGSHCVGLDLLARPARTSRASRRKFLAVGSTGGLAAARARRVRPRRHPPARPGDRHSTTALPARATCTCSPATAGCRGSSFGRATRASRAGRRGGGRRALADPECVMVNRNRGSGTRVLIDRLLGGGAPAGLPDRGAVAQRRGRGGRPGPGRLGRGDRDGGARRPAGLPAAAGRAVRLRGARARLSAPRCGRSCACSPRTVRCAQR